MRWLASKDRNVNDQGRLLCLCFSVLVESLVVTCFLLCNLDYVLMDNNFLAKSFCLDAFASGWYIKILWHNGICQWPVGWCGAG